MKLQLSRLGSVIEWTETLLIFTGVNTLLRLTLVKESGLKIILDFTFITPRLY